MKEYITKAKVIEAIEKAVAPEITTIGDYETIGVFTRESIEQIVSNLPAAEVAEVRHGRWDAASDGDGVVCSECGTDFCTMIHETEKFRFCPNCGAHMDKEAENA